MRYRSEYIFCSEKLISPLAEVQEIFSAVAAVPWISAGPEACWLHAGLPVPSKVTTAPDSEAVPEMSSPPAV